MNKRLAVVLFLLVLLAQQVLAQTQSITIGKFTYLGTVVNSGVVQSVFLIDLDASAVTVNPISFGNAIVIVKGGSSSTQKSGFPSFTTGLGCGLIPNPDPNNTCRFQFTGQAGNGLGTCATYNATKNVFIQHCISVALQLVSPTKKNFSFPLLDGTPFCAYGITNIFVEAPAGYKALDPQCDVNGFCVGASSPIVLQQAPSCS